MTIGSGIAVAAMWIVTGVCAVYAPFLALIVAPLATLATIVITEANEK